MFSSFLRTGLIGAVGATQLVPATFRTLKRRICIWRAGGATGLISLQSLQKIADSTSVVDFAIYLMRVPALAAIAALASVNWRLGQINARALDIRRTEAFLIPVSRPWFQKECSVRMRKFVESPSTSICCVNKNIGFSRPDESKTRSRVNYLRIRIMEDVVNRLSEPSIHYTNKRSTVVEIKKCLDNLKRSQFPHKSPDTRLLGELISSKVRKKVSPALTNQGIADTLACLKQSKVVGVLRGGHPDRLYQRGIELAQMHGCCALEVALDSSGSLEVLAELALALPPSCLIGAATIMNEQSARQAARAGARFLTSPINPPGFIGWCESENVLAIPGGFTPSELHVMLCAGAKAVKLFPACSFTPAGLKQVEPTRFDLSVSD